MRLNGRSRTSEGKVSFHVQFYPELKCFAHQAMYCLTGDTRHPKLNFNEYVKVATAQVKFFYASPQNVSLPKSCDC